MSAGLAVMFVLAAALLLVLGGCFAAAEAALSLRSRADLYRLAEGNSRQDRAIRAIADEEALHLAAASFSRVIAESLAATLITAVLLQTIANLWLALLCSALLLIISTFLLVGASPRKLGIAHPTATIKMLAGLLSFNRVVLGPAAGALQRFSSSVALRSATRHDDEEAENPLLSIVDRAAEAEVLEEIDREYIHSILKLGDTRVHETMVPRPDMHTVPAQATMREALEALLASRHSRMPVIAAEADDVLGVIHLRDAAGFVLRYPEEAETASVTRMMKQALFVPDLMTANDLLTQMQAENNHLALAVDEYGGISGLVTLEDLLEELIGDIYDEHDREDQEAAAQADGSFEVSPRLAVAELGELFEIELEDSDANTVGGLFVKELGRLADTGDQVVVAGIKLVATDVDRRQNINMIRAEWVGEENKHDGS